MCRCIRLIFKPSLTVLFSLLLGVTIIKAHALNRSELIICHEANSYPPYIFMSQGKYTGLLIDIIEKAAQSSSIKLSLYSSPWLRCQKDVQSGRADALFAMAKTPEREKLYKFPPDNPDLYFIWQAQYPVFFKKGKKFDAKNYKPNLGLAAPQGYVVKDIIRKREWLSPFRYEPNEGLLMVSKDKLDGYVLERLAGEHLVEQLALSSKIKATKASLLNTNLYISFNIDFYQSNKQEVDLFWHHIARSRDKLNSVR